MENSLIHRMNRVITDIGLTDEYKMENGIDQGEIISPLLWIIYYDPLFTKIKKEKNIGYRIDHQWISNVCTEKYRKLETEVFNIAYMDDTSWLSNSKKNLEAQLSIADKFNRYNGIKVNPDKSKLLVINNSEQNHNSYVQYGIHSTIIYPEKTVYLNGF